MLLAEYSYATDIEVQREEAKEEGISLGEYKKALETARELIHCGVSTEIISRSTGLSFDELENIEYKVEKL